MNFFNVFSYGAVSEQNSNLSPPRRWADTLQVENWTITKNIYLHAKNSADVLDAPVGILCRDKVILVMPVPNLPIFFI